VALLFVVLYLKSMEDQQSILAGNAIKYVKENRKEIVAKIAGSINGGADGVPVSIFMAGSPGAGKTETSKRLIEQFPFGSEKIVRIDPDDIRVMLPGYDGHNADLFQESSTLAVEYILNFCFDKKKDFILDGTFSSIEKARKNIRRATGHGRVVIILYVFQSPEIAWEFCKKRESLDGRFVPKDQFIKKFFDAKNCVNMIKREYGDKVAVWLVKKNYANEFEGKTIFNVESLDGYLPEEYTPKMLEEKLI
jgi:UDP-N-acetylglucosamine kinase